MSYLELAKQRFSVRKFADRKVGEEELAKILEAGRVAPTAANLQPQRLIVVREEVGLEKLKKAANIFDAPLAIIVCGDHSKDWTRPYDGKGTVDIDTSIVTDHMMMQATELGLGTLWICYFDPQILREEFKIPEQVEPVNILAVGYNAGPIASPDRHETDRKTMKEIISYESFGN